MFAWDDLQVLIALFRERTTGRAAATLGVSQPTVVRRLAALEQGLGVSLFDRSSTGLVPTPAAERLYASAEKVERAVCDFTSEVDSVTGAELNLIRITFLDHFERLLVPVLRQFRSRWPLVQTQLLASDRMYDLTRGEADIAIRGRDRPDSDDIVVHELPPTGWTVYASAHSPADERPSSSDEISNFPIAMLDSSAAKLPVYRWLESRAPTGHSMRCSNYSALRSAVASGAALSVFPCTVGDGDPELVRCFPPMAEFDIPIYLLARRAILRRPPARALFDLIASHFREHPDLLMGKRP